MKRIFAIFLSVLLLAGALSAGFLLVQAEETNTLGGYPAAYASSIAVDGSLSEEAWLLHGKIIGEETASSGTFGAVWNKDNLYFAVKPGEAESVTITVNGKDWSLGLGESGTASGTLASAAAYAVGTDGVVEVSIPFSALGFLVTDYDVQTTLKVELKKGDATAAYDGKLYFSSVTRAKSNVMMAVGTAVADKNNPAPAGQLGAQVTGNAVQLYDRYVEGAQGSARAYGGVTTNTAGLPGLASGVPSDAKGIWFEFDFCAAAMPVYEAKALTDAYYMTYTTYGLNISATGTAPENASQADETISLALTNTDDGIALCGVSPSGFWSKSLDRQVGETFHLGFGWKKDGSLEIYLDGQLFDTIENAVRTPQNSAMRWMGSAEILNFATYLGSAVPESDKDNIDVTISGLSYGYYYGTSALDNLSFSDIQGSNTSASAVTGDLKLESTYSDGRTAPMAINWTSSNGTAISNTGKVTPGEKDVTVTLTATKTGDSSKQKKIEVTVARMMVEALITDQTMNLDGNLTEGAWALTKGFTTQSGDNAPSGMLGALWDADNLYLAASFQNATTLEVTVNDVTKTFALTGSTFEGSIAWSELGVTLTDYGMTMPITAMLKNDSGTASLASVPIDLYLSGTVALHMNPLNNKTSNTGFTLGDGSISLNGGVAAGSIFMAMNLSEMDHTRDMLFEQTICIEEMPVSKPTGNGPYEANGYTFRLALTEPAANTKWCSVLNGTIYNREGGNLALTVFCTMFAESDNTVDLGVKLGERFTLGMLWKADDYSAGHTENNIIEVYVNGVKIKEIAAKNPRAQSYGDHAMVLRYPQAGNVNLTVSNVSITDPGYTSLAQEFTSASVFAGVDLNNVTSKLNLPTTFASKYLGNVAISWESTNESVIATNGTVTRPTGKVGAYVKLTAKSGDKELWSVDVYVPAENSQDVNSPVPLWVANSDKDITVDGDLTEEGWSLSQSIFAANGTTKVGSYGAQWKGDTLYLAVNTGTASTLSLKLGEKTATITLSDLSVTGDLNITEKAKSGSNLELAVKFADIDTIVENYGVEIEASLTLDSGKACEGTLVITSVDWFLTANSSLCTAGPGVTTASGCTSTKTSNQTSVALADGTGARMRDLYDPNGNNPTRIREYAGYIRPKTENIKTENDQATFDAYTPMTDREKVLFTSFDFQAASMPVYTIDSATTEAMLQRTDYWPCYGFSCSVSDAYYSGAMAYALNFGIINTTDGLVACVRGEEFQYYTLGKHVGDLFRIGLSWNLDNSMGLYLDGELVYTFDHAVTSYQYFGNCSVVFNVIRNDTPAASHNDDFDITVTNLALGHLYSENLLDYLTFDDFKGENTDELEITSDLELPASISNGQFASVALTWESSDESVIAPNGTVTQPAGNGKAVTLTAKLPNGNTKEFTLFVKGQNPTGSVLCVTNDLNTATGVGTLQDVYQFTLDTTNNSLVYDLGRRQKVNVIALHDSDTVARLNESVLTIWVSNDNVTYKRVTDDFKLLHDGKDWYLYDFEATGRYIKVHCTHYNGDEADFIGSPDSMIEAYYEDVFGDNGGEFADKITCTVSNTSGETQVDAAWEIDLTSLALENAKADYSDLRVQLDGELLYHYVEDSKLIVRIPVVESGSSVKLTILAGNAAAMDISNKEYVHEVVYGTREAYQSTTYCRYLANLPDGRIIAIGYYYEDETDTSKLTARQQFSSDNGVTWSDWEKIDCTEELWNTDCGGFIVDETTGHLFFHNVRVTKTAEKCEFIWIHSTDMGKTWEVFGTVDAGIDYMLSYSNGIQLSTYDGAGPNVDFAIPLGKRMESEGNPTFGTIVMYSTDAGETWLISEDTVTYGESTKWEGGCSEATLLELEDGRVAMLTRCQIDGIDHFALSYSSDGGIHWSEAVMADSFNPNTQPWLLDFDGTPLLVWGGNNVLGATSYARYPMSVATYSSDMTQVSNIQDLYSRYSLQGLRVATKNKITNQSAVLAGNSLNVAWGNNDSHIMMMRVDNFAQYLYQTKGAYDSFEGSTAKYEGWDYAGTGTAVRSDEQASAGSYSMKISDMVSVSRSVPSVQKGTLSFDLYCTNDNNVSIDLQNAFTTVHNKVSPIAVEIVNGKVTFGGADSGLTVEDGWNSFSFQLDLANGQATLTLNDGEAVTVPVNTDGVDDYVAFVTVTSNKKGTVYLDEFLLKSSHNADLSKIPTDDEEEKPGNPTGPIIPVVGGSTASKPTFIDVSKSDWYYDAVEYVAEQEIMDGVGNHRFAPDSDLTRAMVVTILYRMEQQPATSGKTDFTDVEEGLWYSEAVAWAAENLIVDGYGNGKFGPNDPVTREQLAAILYRYTRLKGGDTGIYMPLGSGVQVSDWAKTYVAWAASKGLYANDTGSNVTATANRAEVAYAIYRLLK